MKILKLTFALPLALLTTPLLSVATPSQMSLASPTKITKNGTQLELEFNLPCKSTYALDVARVVMTNDDSGDLSASVGLVYSQSERECQKVNELKTFTINLNPADLGYPTSLVHEYEAMDINQ